MSPLRHATLAALLLPTFAAAGTARAQDTALTLDAQVQGGYSTNPFLISGGDDTGSAFAEFSIRPQIAQADERGQATLSANYRRTEYFSRYDGTNGYGVDANARRKLTERLTGRALLGFDSSILGQGAYGLPGVVDPTLPPGPGVPDITVLGLRQRQNTFTGGIGADYALGARDSLQADVTVNRLSYGGPSNGALFASRTIGVSGGYTRSLSERTSVGVRGSGSWINFDRPGYSGAYYQAEGTFHRQLSSTLRVDLTAGILFIRSESAFVRRNTTGFAGSGTLCSDRQRQTVCLRAFSNAQPTGFGDVSKRYGAAVDYSYRVNDRDFVSASVDYSRVETTLSAIQTPSSDYINGSATYEHGFTRRLAGGVTAGHRRINGGFVGGGNPDDLSARAYLRIRLGDIR